MARALVKSWSLGLESYFDETNLLMMEFSFGMSRRCSWGRKKRCGSLTINSSRAWLPYIVFHSETSFSAIWVWDKKTHTSSGAGVGDKEEEKERFLLFKDKGVLNLYSNFINIWRVYLGMGLIIRNPDSIRSSPKIRYRGARIKIRIVKSWIRPNRIQIS